MKNKYALEIIFLVLVIALSITGFSSLYVGKHDGPDAYQQLHIITSLVWLLLLLSQLILVSQQYFHRHRTVGVSIFLAGPVLVATLMLLCVHSAAKDAARGRADMMVVQNLMVTLEVALLIVLAFRLRKNRLVHGALLLSTALLFMGIASFFTLVSYVPGFRVEGPDTFHRFGEAIQAASYAVAVIGLLFFLKNRKTGWPWLLAGSFFLLNGFLQALVASMDGTKQLSFLVASIGEAPAFGASLPIFAAMLWAAWRSGNGKDLALARVSGSPEATP